MITENDLFFIASAWNTGTGFIIKGYNIIITTIQVVGLSKKVVIRHNKLGKHSASVVFIDSLNGLVFIELPSEITANIDILNFELSIAEQIVEIYNVDYNCCLNKYKVVITNTMFNYNNCNHFLIDDTINKKISGAIIVNNKHEITGITKYIEDDNLLLGLSSKYLLRSLEEYSIVNDTSIRCSSCHNIVRKQEVISNICPYCTTEINAGLLSDLLPEQSDITKHIEISIKKLKYKIEDTRIGKCFWEITEGSAVIYVRYDPGGKFIVAFSKLLTISNMKNLKKIYSFLLSENSKIKNLSFSIENNDIFISTPYIFEDDFTEDYAYDIFNNLFKTADDYDDIIFNIMNEH